MYESFYGFTGKPFQLSPDPGFYFASREHRRAMGFVEYGLHQGEGFIVVTGEVGAGKTTVIRSLLDGMASRSVRAATLVSTQLGPEDTLRLVAAAFGAPTRGLPKSDVLLGLEAHLGAEAARGRRCLLVVDEAQNLAPEAVEELRMLSNFQYGARAMLQTFLVGQPEFRRILQGAGMTQLRQRVIAACHIGPLDAGDSRGYVEHRLARVGWRGRPQIGEEAFAAVHEASGGIPRRINLLCDRVLLAGFLSGDASFTAAGVREVAAGLEAETLAPPAEAAGDEAPGAEETVATVRRLVEWIRQGGRDRGGRA